MKTDRRPSSPAGKSSPDGYGGYVENAPIPRAEAVYQNLSTSTAGTVYTPTSFPTTDTTQPSPLPSFASVLWRRRRQQNSVTHRMNAGGWTPHTAASTPLHDRKETGMGVPPRSSGAFSSKPFYLLHRHVSSSSSISTALPQTDGRAAAASGIMPLHTSGAQDGRVGEEEVPHATPPPPPPPPPRWETEETTHRHEWRRQGEAAGTAASLAPPSTSPTSSPLTSAPTPLLSSRAGLSPASSSGTERTKAIIRAMAAPFSPAAGERAKAADVPLSSAEIRRGTTTSSLMESPPPPPSEPEAAAVHSPSPLVVDGSSAAETPPFVPLSLPNGMPPPPLAESFPFHEEEAVGVPSTSAMAAAASSPLRSPPAHPTAEEEKEGGASHPALSPVPSLAGGTTPPTTAAMATPEKKTDDASGTAADLLASLFWRKSVETYPYAPLPSASSSPPLERGPEGPLAATPPSRSPSIALSGHGGGGALFAPILKYLSRTSGMKSDAGGGGSGPTPLSTSTETAHEREEEAPLLPSSREAGVSPLPHPTTTDLSQDASAAASLRPSTSPPTVAAATFLLREMMQQRRPLLQASQWGTFVAGGGVQAALVGRKTRPLTSGGASRGGLGPTGEAAEAVVAPPLTAAQRTHETREAAKGQATPRVVVVCPAPLPLSTPLPEEKTSLVGMEECPGTTPTHSSSSSSFPSSLSSSPLPISLLEGRSTPRTRPAKDDKDDPHSPDEIQDENTRHLTDAKKEEEEATPLASPLPTARPLSPPLQERTGTPPTPPPPWPPRSAGHRYSTHTQESGPSSVASCGGGGGGTTASFSTLPPLEASILPVGLPLPFSTAASGSCFLVSPMRPPFPAPHENVGDGPTASPPSPPPPPEKKKKKKEDLATPMAAPPSPASTAAKGPTTDPKRRSASRWWREDDIDYPPVSHSPPKRRPSAASQDRSAVPTHEEGSGGGGEETARDHPTITTPLSSSSSADRRHQNLSLRPQRVASAVVVGSVGPGCPTRTSPPPPPPPPNANAAVADPTPPSPSGEAGSPLSEVGTHPTTASSPQPGRPHARLASTKAPSQKKAQDEANERHEPNDHPGPPLFVVVERHQLDPFSESYAASRRGGEWRQQQRVRLAKASMRRKSLEMGRRRAQEAAMGGGGGPPPPPHHEEEVSRVTVGSEAHHRTAPPPSSTTTTTSGPRPDASKEERAHIRKRRTEEKDHFTPLEEAPCKESVPLPPTATPTTTTRMVDENGQLPLPEEEVVVGGEEGHSERQDTKKSEAEEETDVLLSRASALRVKGNAYFHAEDYGSAIRLYSRALSLDPRSVALLCNRAAAYCGEFAYTVALMDAECAIHLCPSHAKAHWRAGKCCFALMALEKAKAHYHTALQWYERIARQENGGRRPSRTATRGGKTKPEDRRPRFFPVTKENTPPLPQEEEADTDAPLGSSLLSGSTVSDTMATIACIQKEYDSLEVAEAYVEYGRNGEWEKALGRVMALHQVWSGAAGNASMGLTVTLLELEARLHVNPQEVFEESHRLLEKHVDCPELYVMTALATFHCAHDHSSTTKVLQLLEREESCREHQRSVTRSNLTDFMQRIYPSYKGNVGKQAEEEGTIASDLPADDGAASSAPLPPPQAAPSIHIASLEKVADFPLHSASATQLYTRVQQFMQLRDEGDAAYSASDWPKAYAAYSHCLEIDPNNASLLAASYCNRAAVEIQLDHWDNALQDCTAALKYQPENTNALGRRARVYLHFYESDAEDETDNANGPAPPPAPSRTFQARLGFLDRAVEDLHQALSFLSAASTERDGEAGRRVGGRGGGGARPMSSATIFSDRPSSSSSEATTEKSFFTARHAGPMTASDVTAFSLRSQLRDVTKERQAFVEAHLRAEHDKQGKPPSRGVSKDRVVGGAAPPPRHASGVYGGPKSQNGHSSTNRTDLHSSNGGRPNRNEKEETQGRRAAAAAAPPDRHSFSYPPRPPKRDPSSAAATASSSPFGVGGDTWAEKATPHATPFPSSSSPFFASASAFPYPFRTSTGSKDWGKGEDTNEDAAAPGRTSASPSTKKKNFKSCPETWRMDDGTAKAGVHDPKSSPFPYPSSASSPSTSGSPPSTDAYTDATPHRTASDHYFSKYRYFQSYFQSQSPGPSFSAGKGSSYSSGRSDSSAFSRPHSTAPHPGSPHRAKEEERTFHHRPPPSSSSPYASSTKAESTGSSGGAGRPKKGGFFQHSADFGGAAFQQEYDRSEYGRSTFGSYASYFGHASSGSSSKGASRNTEQSASSSVFDGSTQACLRLFGLSGRPDRQQVRKAFREAALKWHPDKWSAGTVEQKELAEKHFKEINVANSVLLEHFGY